MDWGNWREVVRFVVVRGNEMEMVDGGKAKQKDKRWVGLGM